MLFYKNKELGMLCPDCGKGSNIFHSEVMAMNEVWLKNLKMLKYLIEAVNKRKYTDLEFLKSLNINSATFPLHGYKDEDFSGWYITKVKMLIRKLEPDVLNDLYDDENRTFPIFKFLLQLCHHSDNMIKASARISVMTIIRKSKGQVNDSIIQEFLPGHLLKIISTLKCHIIDIQTFLDRESKFSVERTCYSFEEELDYMNDVMLVARCSFKEHVLAHLIEPAFLPTLFNNNRDYRSWSVVLDKVCLFLFCKLLDILTETELKEAIFGLLISYESKQAQSLYFSEKDILLKKANTEEWNSCKFFIFNDESRILTLYFLYILKLIVEFYIYRNDYRMLLKFYTLHLANIIEVLDRIEFFDELEDTKVELLTLVIKPLAKTRPAMLEPKWVELRNTLQWKLQALYSTVSANCKVNNILNFITLADEEYERFINKTIDIKNPVSNINYLIEKESFVSDTSDDDIRTLQKLFCIRKILLLLRETKENTLPFLMRKIKIAEIFPLINCIPCQKLGYNNKFQDKHFLKLTNGQVLVLQRVDGRDNFKGIVIFCSYYKDVRWSHFSHNGLSIYEFNDRHRLNWNMKSRMLGIHLKFNNSLDLKIIISLLTEAKKKQEEVLQKKIEDFLQKSRRKKCFNGCIFKSEQNLKNGFYQEQSKISADLCEKVWSNSQNQIVKSIRRKYEGCIETNSKLNEKIISYINMIYKQDKYKAITFSLCNQLIKNEGLSTLAHCCENSSCSEKAIINHFVTEYDNIVRIQMCYYISKTLLNISMKLNHRSLTENFMIPCAYNCTNSKLNNDFIQFMINLFQSNENSNCNLSIKESDVFEDMDNMGESWSYSTNVGGSNTTLRFLYFIFYSVLNSLVPYSKMLKCVAPFKTRANSNPKYEKNSFVQKSEMDKNKSLGIKNKIFSCFKFKSKSSTECARKKGLKVTPLILRQGRCDKATQTCKSYLLKHRD